MRDRDVKLDRRTAFCMAGYEIGAGLYVLMEAHFQHRMGTQGVYTLVNFLQKSHRTVSLLFLVLLRK